MGHKKKSAANVIAMSNGKNIQTMDSFVNVVAKLGMGQGADNLSQYSSYNLGPLS